MDTDVKVGQLVRIINTSKVYHHYVAWAGKHIPSQYHWMKGAVPGQGIVGEVVAIAPLRPTNPNILCAVFNRDFPNTYIMHIKGVTIVQSAPSPDEPDNHSGMIHNPITGQWSWF